MDTPFLKHLISLVLTRILPLFFIVGAIFFYFGFRITSSLHVLRPGTLTVIVPHAETNLYLDKTFIGKTTKEQELFVRKGVAPGNHLLAVEKNGYWPWAKTITIKSGDRLTFHPFTVNKNPSGSIITDADPEYYKIDDLISAASYKDVAMSNVASTTLYKEGDALYLNTKESTPIYKGIYPIRAFSFFPEYADVAIIASDNGIYALELTDDKTPNFQPLYKGLSPTFTLSANHTLLIKDFGTLMELSW